jgi:hypothetical protein
MAKRPGVTSDAFQVARNLYDPKIKRIFEIARADFEIILFIHLNKHMDGARDNL